MFDGGGLYLEISPAGGEWWRLKYRFGGKEKRLSLGVYPAVSLKEARGRRDASRKLLADGVDPGVNRKATNSARSDRAANSFEVVAREWYGKYSPGWATSHASRIGRVFERDIFPWMGGRPLAEITAPDYWPSCGASKPEARLKPHTESSVIAVRCFAMVWRLVGVSETHLAICAAHCRLSRENTLLRQPNRGASPKYFAR